jgi:Peptidase C13 family
VQCFHKLVTLTRIAALAAVFLVLDAAGLAGPVHFSRGGGNFPAPALARDRPGAPENEAARLEQSQQALLHAEVAHIAPPNKGVTNVYAIGIAGWADQDVFIKELDGGLAVFDRILPARSHTVRLVNGRDTAKTLPLATERNFAAAVHAVAAVMDRNADVLLLLMTSHGDRRGFMLRLPNAATSELTPQDVAATLDKEGIKYRIVIVSACFSGIFVPPLANDNSIVLTAADSWSASFGCAAEREWTYFGDAFFRQSLRPGIDLMRAFDNARVLVHGWEMMDHAPPSNPQGHFGPALVEKLAPFFAAAPNAEQ